MAILIFTQIYRNHKNDVPMEPTIERFALNLKTEYIYFYYDFLFLYKWIN